MREGWERKGGEEEDSVGGEEREWVEDDVVSKHILMCVYGYICMCSMYMYMYVYVYMYAFTCILCTFA